MEIPGGSSDTRTIDACTTLQAEGATEENPAEIAIFYVTVPIFDGSGMGLWLCKQCLQAYSMIV